MSEPLSQLNLLRIDTRNQDVQSLLDGLRQRMSSRGELVSEEGQRLTKAVFGEALSPQTVVQRICEDVRREGLPAVLRYSKQLDQAELSTENLRVSNAELAQAHAQADANFLATIRRIRDNIQEFQQAILHRDVTVQRASGVSLWQRYLPLDRVGVCVPGGTAAYPSTVLMTAVPAQAAGVRQIAVVAPPTPFGANNPDVLATCHEIGVSEVYRVGGAQGVAALAYGVPGIPKVDKIVGPGNLFVALAKRYVYGEVSIDSIAGPSEVVVIADETSRPEYVAADMLAQAEHAPGASILVTWSSRILEATVAELNRQVAGLSRIRWTVQSLQSFGALIRVRDEQEACDITNSIAPEHLHVAIEGGERLVPRLRHAGATFVGPCTPVALGDYVAGPSHVLPTGGTARWASGLSANDFLRSGSVVAYSREALREVAQHVQTMADREGLTAHRASIDVRLSSPPALERTTTP